MPEKIKKKIFKNILQFLKLQLAGNVLFWGTYAGNALFREVLHWSSAQSLATASVVAHIAFFIIDKNWVFSTKTGKAKTSGEIVRFIIFMGFNYFLNLGIVLGLEQYFGITSYIGQFISALFFTFWTWLGLKFWVFRHARHLHHAALTLETKNIREKRHARYKRLATKQKAKRAA